MITQLFIPKRIGSYFIRKTKVLAVEFSKNYLNATLCLAIAKKRTVLKTLSIELKPGINLTEEEIIISALQQIKSYFGKHDKLILVLPANMCIFKEMGFPLLGRTKISQVVSLELESTVAFPPEKANFDFIITHEDKVNKFSEIMLCAVKKDNVNQLIGYFDKVGLTVDKITVDAFETYAYVLSLKKYNDIENLVVIDTVKDLTKIIIINKSKLKFIRAIQTNNPAEIKFNLDVAIEKLKLQQPSLILSTEELKDDFSTAASLCLPETLDFDLQNTEKEIKIEKEISQSLKISIFLAISIIISSIIYSFIRIRRVKRYINTIESAQVEKLQKLFQIKSQEKSLSKAIDTARKKLSKDGNGWLRFSPEYKQHVLNVLTELSKSIVNQNIGLDLEKIKIQEDKVLIYGSVPDYPQLNKLQQKLDTPMFIVPKLYDLNFKTNPITISFKKEVLS